MKDRFYGIMQQIPLWVWGRKWKQTGVYGKFSSTFSQTSLGFTCLQYKSIENSAGKGEIACNKQFLLFPPCFLPFWRTFTHFNYILGWVENIVKKVENAGYQHFLLFPQCFQKASFSGSLKVQLNIYQTIQNLGGKAFLENDGNTLLTMCSTLSTKEFKLYFIWHLQMLLSVIMFCVVND